MTALIEDGHYRPSHSRFSFICSMPTCSFLNWTMSCIFLHFFWTPKRQSVEEHTHGQLLFFECLLGFTRRLWVTHPAFTTYLEWEMMLSRQGNCSAALASTALPQDASAAVEWLRGVRLNLGGHSTDARKHHLARQPTSLCWAAEAAACLTAPQQQHENRAPSLLQLNISAGMQNHRQTRSERFHPQHIKRTGPTWHFIPWEHDASPEWAMRDE